MNRRYKQKPKTDYVAIFRQTFSQLDWRTIKPSVLAAWHRLPSRNRRGLQIITPIVLVLMFLPLPNPKLPQQTKPSRIAVNISTVGLSEKQSQTIDEPIETQEATRQVENKWVEYKVKRGDTLAKVFRTNALPMSDLNALVRIEGADKPLSRIKQGQRVRFKLASNGKLDILQLEKANQSVMFLRMSDGSFTRSK